ncbi:thioesterase family protein [Aquisalimonas sp.]|uniref:acyl-CoA thioesterase n=1 Tax=Aquisalimonas sp. TaxID=1872621 RepID=UPI0025C569B2|nr:thioesterase family protein [Aquisalimonas sp.]
MTPLLEVYRNSVQSWEIDMMGHMNVKFYVEKSVAALAMLGQHLGLGPRFARESGACLVPTEHHVRFLREQRPGAPLVINAGIVEATRERLVVYQEMVNAASGDLAASFIVTVPLQDGVSRESRPIPEHVLEQTQPLRTEVPAHGAPRGLEMAPPRSEPTLDEAVDKGMLSTWKGPVLPRMCDHHGRLATEAHMGIVSDAIPNLLVHLTAEDRSESPLGGAALEYRFVYRRPVSGDDLLELRSGIKAVSTKTYQFGHWLFNGATGECVATAEAVAVLLDLDARKAVVIPEASRAVLERHVIPGLSA